MRCLKNKSLSPLKSQPNLTSSRQLKSQVSKKNSPSIDLSKNKVGIFGKKTTLDHPLNDRDRIEIYRPLILDPKEMRRKRAAKK